MSWKHTPCRSEGHHNNVSKCGDRYKCRKNPLRINFIASNLAERQLEKLLCDVEFWI